MSKGSKPEDIKKAVIKTREAAIGTDYTEPIERPPPPQPLKKNNNK